jgi:subfamily B ATP-binding cassette protein MsbA
MTRINTDTGIAEQLITTSIADLTRGPIEIVACISFIIYHAIDKGLYSISLAMVLAAPICIFPIMFLGRRIKKLTHKSLRKISILTSHMLETFSGIRVVKAYHMEDEEHKRFVDANNTYFIKVQKSMKYELMISPLMEFVGVLIICLFLIYAYMKGLVLADLLPFGVASTLAYQPMKRIGKVITNMNRSLTGAARAFNLLDMRSELKESENPVVIHSFKDKFEFKNIDFSYDEDSPKIIDNLSLEIKKGEIVAFVGETGSGKSTISNLFARFYDPTKGQILLDGIDLREIEIKSLREAFLSVFIFFG